MSISPPSPVRGPWMNLHQSTLFFFGEHAKALHVVCITRKENPIQRIGIAYKPQERWLGSHNTMTRDGAQLEGLLSAEMTQPNSSGELKLDLVSDSSTNIAGSLCQSLENPIPLLPQHPDDEEDEGIKALPMRRRNARCLTSGHQSTSAPALPRRGVGDHSGAEDCAIPTL